jgi:hypothetical protein
MLEGGSEWEREKGRVRRCDEAERGREGL